MKRFSANDPRTASTEGLCTLTRSILLIAFLVLISGPANAYIGPGAGLGGIALTIALVLGIVLLLVGFLWYPLKRLLRGRKRATRDSAAHNDADR